MMKGMKGIIRTFIVKFFNRMSMFSLPVAMPLRCQWLEAPAKPRLRSNVTVVV